MRKTVIYGLVWFAALQLPIWTVRDASTDGRWFASFFLTVICFLMSTLGALGSLSGTHVKPQVKYKPIPYLPEISLFVFIACSITCSLLTYVDDSIILSETGSMISAIGSYTLPFVDKYETVMHLRGNDLIRVQSIMTVIVLGSLLLSLYVLASTFLLPVEEKILRYSNRSSEGGTFAVLGVVLFLFFSARFYFGWSEFDPGAALMDRDAKGCVFRAYCYTRGSDFLLMFVALFKVFFIASVPLILGATHIWLTGRRAGAVHR